MKIVAIVGSLIMMVGIILVYDARLITKKLFSFGDQNEAALLLKIVGFIISTVGGFLIML